MNIRLYKTLKKKTLKQETKYERKEKKELSLSRSKEGKNKSTSLIILIIVYLLKGTVSVISIDPPSKMAMPD